MDAKTFTTGQRVVITRGLQRGATGVVHSQVGQQYVITLEPGRSASSAMVKAPSLRAA